MATDGYGDYVRHYLRSMAVKPELAPASKNRFLGTASIVTSSIYSSKSISYSTFGEAKDLLRLKARPKTIKCDGVVLKETSYEKSDGYSWRQLSTGGVLNLRHSGNNIAIEF